MIHITEEDIKSRLWEIYIEKDGQPLRKSEFKDYEGIPSYNTCMRRGINLNEVNSEFHKKYYELYSYNKCRECNSVLPFDKKNNTFCSSSCAASFNLRVRYKDLVKKPLVQCLWCGTDLHQNFSKSRKYCNSTCQQLFMSCGRFIDWYVNGITKGLGVTSLKSFVEIKDGYKCSCCGIAEWNNIRIGLELEHIDGNSDNNSVENLCLLCPNCHSQTPTYKARNKGNGRFSRRERYQQGKSY